MNIPQESRVIATTILSRNIVLNNYPTQCVGIL